MSEENNLREASLATAVSVNYGLSESLQCTLIRAGFNHHYLIESAGQRYVLRVYLNGKYYIKDADDFRFELAFLDYLARQGIPVARPLANQQGEWLTLLQSPTTPEYMVLFEFAEGRMFDGAGLKDADIRRVGVLAAKLHQASDRFRSTYHRYHLNPEYLLEKPLRTLQAHLARRKLGDLAFFAPVAEELWRKLAQLPRTAPAYGLIHGDLIGSNLHLDEQGQFTLIDFDHCGYGWRAYELVPWGFTTLAVLALVVEGYEAVRPLSALEKTLLPDFIKLREIWGIGDILNMYSVWGRTADDEELNEYVALLRGLM